MKINKNYLRSLIKEQLEENAGQIVYVVMQAGEIFGVYSDEQKATQAKGENDRSIFKVILDSGAEPQII